MIKFGDMDKKGYCGEFRLTFPEISFSQERYLNKVEFTKNVISFPTLIKFTNNSYCVTITMRLLGFGFYFELLERRI